MKTHPLLVAKIQYKFPETVELDGGLKVQSVELKNVTSTNNEIIGCNIITKCKANYVINGIQIEPFEFINTHLIKGDEFIEFMHTLNENDATN